MTSNEIIKKVRNATPLHWETPEEAVDFARAAKTLGNKTIDAICDTWGLSIGHASRLVEEIKAERQADRSSGQSVADARIDRISNIRDSSGRATPRSWRR